MEQEYVGVERRKSGWKKYRNIGFTAFAVIAAAVVLVFVFYKFEQVQKMVGTLNSVLAPVFLGILFAYIMNPMMGFFEKHINNILSKIMRRKKRAAGLSRALGIILSIIVVIGAITLLIVMIAPEIAKTVSIIIEEAEPQTQAFLDWFNGLSEKGGRFSGILTTVVTEITKFVESFIENDLADFAKEAVEYVASGVFSAFNIIYNIAIGIVFSIYILTNKEKFAGQTKKLLYSFVKPYKANYMVRTARKCHSIFSGAITGKILDSTIIGVLCFVGMTIFEFPYAVLVSVIIGVTNVIPFFGPFIGGVPSALLILFVDPWSALWFVVFLICLQQFDCNILDPRIVGGTIGLSAFWVLFSCVVFGGLFGILGLLLGVPSFACIYVIVKEAVEAKLKRRGMITETDDFVSLDQMELEQFNRPEEPKYGRRATDMRDGKPYGRRATDYQDISLPEYGAGSGKAPKQEVRADGTPFVERRGNRAADTVNSAEEQKNRREESEEDKMFRQLDKYLLDEEDRRAYSVPKTKEQKKSERKEKSKKRKK